jgi:hypothetical protein
MRIVLSVAPKGPAKNKPLVESVCAIWNVARKGGGQSGSRRGPYDRGGRVMPAEERALTSGVLCEEGKER